MKFAVLRLAYFIAYKRIASITTAIPEIWDECVRHAAGLWENMESRAIVPWVD